MSARELRSLQAGVNSPPKRGRKRGQSNTEATNTKRAKATTKNDVEGSGEEEPEAGKGTIKGKSGGKKGKKATMTGAQRAAKDKAENDKGVPAQLTPVERALEAAGTSVAPPKRTGKLSTPSFLPPAPTLSSSRSHINCEPEVTAGHEEVSGEESDEGDEVDEVDEGSDGKDIRFGPPRGRHQAKSGSGHEEPLAKDIDLSNLAPPETEVPANGSSRSTGGILRGRAVGNLFNIGDSIYDAPQEVRPLSNGRINITIVQQPPSDVVIDNATSHLNVKSPCFETLGPLLKKVAKSYSPVRNHNYRVYILDKKQWSIMGRYNVVVEDDEDAIWEEDDIGKVTHILLENDHEQMVASAIPPSFHQCSVSLGSHSGSVPRSSSVASDSRGQSQASSISRSEVTGPSKLSSANKALLLEYLGIDRDLASLDKAGLQSAYQKFKAIINATPKVMGLSKDAEWKSQFDDGAAWVPNIVDFIHIFIAKTQFYQVWKPTFLRAEEYPDMRDWLNEEEDCLATEDLWDLRSSRVLSFPDLKKWLDKKDREGELKKRGDLKGKRKAPDSPKKNRDKDKHVEQRKHKKLKQARVRDLDEEASE
ncbi:uncharacterized protein LACBIDRAFT_307791 [Laccaria bicolor S238N-H82]|uniref:Predicted protein n=1 Tax=Laccaria bicolor (strain S238N-H82 / ATCC MYA-4686) TaxID=486041 RepID=B0DR24_LACBS|nr:uncharacterized protein LACBIDRAFT_307791 [Laccaria bicolor S238N-H82]EDR02990.1 predicted protein [Laccaria bicolor S238N-H82]|eukprot:XP_001886413.1 predicted protein [Laccaria bicolor S238N-H82]